MIKPFFAVPPQAQKPFNFWAMLARSVVFSSMPSITVDGLPNFLVSRRMRIRCCSFSISPQTHKSFGSPHVVQTSAMTLNHSIVNGVYKSFKANGAFTVWLLLVATVVRLCTRWTTCWNHKGRVSKGFKNKAETFCSGTKNANSFLEQGTENHSKAEKHHFEGCTT